jgi:hypothetical protein
LTENDPLWYLRKKKQAKTSKLAKFYANFLTKRDKMVINEVFPNPTVKQVIFQIRYPNLFYIENKIGDFQLKVMREFPESALIMKQRVIFAEFGPNVTIDFSANENGPTFANQNEPTRIAVILVQQPTANFI